MEFSRLSSPSLKDLFVRQIQSMILSGELPIGSRLPPEREIAQQMQVSRAVVNGGIAELSRQGFLTVSPRVGTVVADYRHSGTIDTLLAIMDFQGQVLGKQEIRSLLQVRKALEHLAADQAISNASDQELRDLGIHLTRVVTAGSGQEAADAAYSFHHELMLISGNTILPLLYCSCRGPITALWTRHCQLYGVDTLCRNMEKLYDCLCRRDRSGAARWIDTYLNESIDGNRSLFEKEDTSSRI